jgi:hypothetical protein
VRGEQLDTPNQQVVRPDGSAAWDEGTGGGEPPAPAPKAKAKADPEPAPAEDEAPAEGA